MLDLGLSAEQALAQPRIHHQWFPNELLVETNLPPELQTALQQFGHKLKPTSVVGISQIVAQDPKQQNFRGAADPRSEGKAAGW